MDIKENTIVKINYVGTLSDGTIFDSSEGREPLEFLYGMGMIIPGLEEGILGLKVGDKKKVEVKAEKAYGQSMEEAVQEVPKNTFPADIELKEGLQLAAQGPQGTIPVVVKEIKDEVVVVDFNHPLAGKDLTFDIEVIEVKEASEEDIQKFMAPFEHHHHGEEEGCCGGGHCSSHGEEKEEKGECCGGHCKN